MLIAEVDGLVHLAPESWDGVLAAQRALCEEVVRSHEGVGVTVSGDPMYVFGSAPRAVAAAVALQRRVATTRWPVASPVLVRIGVHSGTPLLLDRTYVGMDVTRTARIAGAAHGGQVLVSEAVAGMCAGHEGDVDYVGVGGHRLRGIPEEMHLFQAVTDGLETTFTSPRTLGASASLPGVQGPILGRDGELAELSALLDEGRRLVTLTGPGGSGKTRLAIELARRKANQFADGCYFVPLVTATSQAHVWPAIADVMELPAAAHVPPGIFDHLADREALVVLDNLEQLHDADASVRNLLERAPRLSVVATSRRPLHIDGEFDHQVPPLLLPDVESSFDGIASSGAVQMFLEHARRAKRGFDLTTQNAGSVARLCVALDGLPLAIELVAARVKMFSPEALVARLDELLDVSSHDRSKSERQRTIRGAISWSYELLSEPQRHVLHALAVFEGGGSAQAIGWVAQSAELSEHQVLDVLFDLMDASLVWVEDQDDGEPRFHLLETIKLFALERVSAARGLDEMSARHAQWCYDLARDCYWDLSTPIDGAEHAAKRARFLRDLPNLRAALARRPQTVQHPDPYGNEFVPTSHVFALLCRLAFNYRRYPEAIAWSEVCLSLPDSDPAAVASVLLDRASASRYLKETSEVLLLFEEALEAVRKAPSDPSLPSWLNVDEMMCQCLLKLVMVAAGLKDLEYATRVHEELLAVSAVMPLEQRALAAAAGWEMAEVQGDLAQAYECAIREGSLRRATGSSLYLLWWVNNVADLEARMGNRTGAFERIGQHLEAFITFGDPQLLAYLTETLATTVGPEDPVAAAQLIGSAQQLRTVEGLPKAQLESERDELAVLPTRALLSAEEWDDNVERGSRVDVATLMRQVCKTSPST